MTVIIGVDPHKRSHTAVAIDADEVELGRVHVRASRTQLDELIGWASQFDGHTWAVESVDGLGYLLGQQLVAADERVLDVPATLAARVRVLASGRSQKTDPNDGYSIAVAARRAPQLRMVARSDHAAVLRLLAKRNKQLGSARTAAACRLHTLLAELVPGGISKEMTSTRAARLLERLTPQDPVEATRHLLALGHLDDVRRLDRELRALHRRMADAVNASGTTVTELFGFGPWAPRSRSATPATCGASGTGIGSPPTTAPPPSRCPRANAPCTDCRDAGTGSSIMQSTSPPSPRSVTGTHRAAPTTNANSPKAKRIRKPSERSSDGSATRSTTGSSPTHARTRVREGKRGHLNKSA
jgi:transposase